MLCISLKRDTVRSNSKAPTGAIEDDLPVFQYREGRANYYGFEVQALAKLGEALGIRWLIDAAKKRNENTMEERLAGELADAVNNRGTAVKKREDTHKMADANKAFSHYRW